MSISPYSQGDEPLSGHAFPLLYNVVYCSRAAEGIDDAAVNSIIETARRWNPAQGITGLLVFGSGIFFQWLEGPRDNVTQLMANLKKDPRHQDIVPLSAIEEVRERLFPDWDMELVTGDDIRDVLVDALDHAKDANNIKALELLLTQLDAGQIGGLGKAA
ncbi:MAG: BLUF domain-containing protein [Vitreoscilla sp.]|nr:BLUF domain-containing protein [Polaromonas sp.]